MIVWSAAYILRSAEILGHEWETSYYQFSIGNWAAPFIVPDGPDWRFAGADFGATLNSAPTDVFLLSNRVEHFHQGGQISYRDYPDAVLEYLTVNNEIGVDLTLHVDSISHPRLEANTKYWITFKPIYPNAAGYWRGYFCSLLSKTGQAGSESH